MKFEGKKNIGTVTTESACTICGKLQNCSSNSLLFLIRIDHQKKKRKRLGLIFYVHRVFFAT